MEQQGTITEAFEALSPNEEVGIAAEAVTTIQREFARSGHPFDHWEAHRVATEAVRRANETIKSKNTPSS